MTSKIISSVVVALAIGLLSACSGGGTQSLSGAGTAFGGRSPIKGATVTVYTVDNNSGARTTATTTSTDGNGAFSVNFNCPATSQVYFALVGGDAGGGASNAAINLLNVPLDCANLADGFFANIDEATTAAAVYALAGNFLTNTGDPAASPSNIPASFALALSLANSTTGQVNTGLAGQAQPAINSLANSLAACVNSSGPASASCTNLFNAVAVSGVAAPTDTLTAAMAVAYYPLAVNATSVYNAASPNSIYTPAFAAPPADWSLQMNLLQDTQNIPFQNFTSDQFSWFDSTAQKRAAVLAHNDGGCANGSCGGELRDFQYVNGGSVLDASAPSAGDDAGFGYVVSHPHQDEEAGTMNSYCVGGPAYTAIGPDGSGAATVYDTSSLGHGYTGTWSRLFVGRHHSIFDFNTTYNRYCPQSDEAFSANCIGTAHGNGTGGCGAAVNGNPMTSPWVIPVTIGWVFGTGADNPIWSVTYDVGASPSQNPDKNDTLQNIANGEIEDDTRGPYGVLMWDGETSTDGTMTNPVAGAAWGDGYDFTTSPLTGPLTLSSSWSWSSSSSGNSAYAALWTTAVDAQMGVVQTQTVDLQDAGGGSLYGGPFGSSTAPTAYLDFNGGTHYSSCTSGDLYSQGGGGPGPGGTEDFNTGLVFIMPCIDQWPYQLDEFNFDGFGTAALTTTSLNHFPKIAWGAAYGFLGEQGYFNYMRGTNNYPGAAGAPETVNDDWHAKNYSTWVVLGQKQATDAVQNQLVGLNAIKHVSLSATVGSVATSGPIGIKYLTSAPPAAYPQTQTYNPAGYDPVLGALTFIASGGNLSAGIAVNVGTTLAKPLVVVRGFTGTTASGYPSHIVLDGVELVADKDYFPSLWTAQNQLWLTLNASLGAGSHTLSISN